MTTFSSLLGVPQSLQHHPLSWCPRLGGLCTTLTEPQLSVVIKTQQHLMLTRCELACTLLSTMLGRKKKYIHRSQCTGEPMSPPTQGKTERRQKVYFSRISTMTGNQPYILSDLTSQIFFCNFCNNMRKVEKGREKKCSILSLSP